MLIGMLPMTIMAQDDDLYFVPKKKAAGGVKDNYGMPAETYYAGSDRSIDDYNRRGSSYEIIAGDSAQSDIIDFSSVQGVYPDAQQGGDYELTRQMSRFDDYDISTNEAFWAGYRAGRDDWGWHSPWYYNRYGWYGGWYDPWYWDSWHYGWYDPWYYGYAGWYGGWYSPWRYGYYGWGYPYYWGGYYAWGWNGIGSGRGHIYARNGNTGTINRNGSTHGRFSGYRGNTAADNNGRSSSLRNRTVTNHTTYNNSGNTNRSNSGNFGGNRSSSVGSFGGSSGARSGGSFGGGGGGRSGGGGLGGRR